MKLLYTLILKSAFLFEDIGSILENFAGKFLIDKVIKKELKKAIDLDTHEAHSKYFTRMDWDETEFGKEKNKLVEEHIALFIKMNKRDPENSVDISSYIHDILIDYESLIIKYHGLVPLNDVRLLTRIEPLKEETEKINIDIDRVYSPHTPVDSIITDLRDRLIHLKETYKFDDTPIWVQITQHAEVKKGEKI